MVAEFLNKIVFTIFSAIINLIVKYLIEPIVTFVTNFTIAILSFYFYQISVMLLSVVDLLSDFFQMLAGIQLYSGPGQAPNNSGIRFTGVDNFFVNGQDVGDAGGDLLFQLLISEPVMETLIAVTTVGLFLTIFSSMVMIIKQEFDPDKPNNKMKVLGTALKSFLYMIFVPVICIFGVFLSNEVLQLVHLATSDFEGATISGMIFTSAAQNAGYGQDDMFISLADPVTGAITAGLSTVMKALTDNDTGISAEEDDLQADSSDGQVFTKAQMRTIMDAYIYISKRNQGPHNGNIHYIIYINGNKKSAFTEEGAIKILKTYDNKCTTLSNMDEKSDGKYLKNTNIKYFDNKNDAMSYSTEGDGDGNVCIYFSSTAIYRSYYNSYQVSMDFDNTKINYLVLIVTTVIIMKALGSASVALIMRLYKAVAFFLILPGVLGLGPMDGGSTFNSWKKTFIGEVLAAYGFVISVNLYLFLAPLVQNLSISYTPTNFDPDVIQSGASGLIMSAMNVITNTEMAASIMKMMFILTGALMIEKLASTISGFIGGVDLASIGKSMMSEVGKTAATGFSVGTKLTIGAMATTATMYGGIASKIKGATKGGIREFKNIRAEGFKGSSLSKGINKIRGGATAEERAATKATKGGLLKRGATALGGGIKSTAKGLALKTMGKAGKSIKYARANFDDAEKGFKEADIAYAQAKEAYDANPTKENQDKLNAADQKRDMALDKYKKETKKYENTASTIAKGSFKTAEAGAAYALNTVLNSLPGADIAKNLWGQHKEAQDQVDKRSENNQNRAEDLKEFAKEIKNKIGEKTPINRAHIKDSNNQFMQEVIDLTQTKIMNSEREKWKTWRRFIEAMKRNEGNPAAQMRIKEAAAKEYMTDASGNLLTEEGLRTQLQVYQKIPLAIKKMKNTGGNSNKMLKEMEKIFADVASDKNKPLYKDIMKLFEDIKSQVSR